MFKLYDRSPPIPLLVIKDTPPNPLFVPHRSLGSSPDLLLSIQEGETPKK